MSKGIFVVFHIYPRQNAAAGTCPIQILNGNKTQHLMWSIELMEGPSCILTCEVWLNFTLDARLFIFGVTSFCKKISGQLLHQFECIRQKTFDFLHFGRTTQTIWMKFLHMWLKYRQQIKARSPLLPQCTRVHLPSEGVRLCDGILKVHIYQVIYDQRRLIAVPDSGRWNWCQRKAETKQGDSCSLNTSQNFHWLHL